MRRRAVSIILHAGTPRPSWSGAASGSVPFPAFLISSFIPPPASVSPHVPDALFQALETGTAGFSNHWKKSRCPFPRHGKVSASERFHERCCNLRRFVDAASSRIRISDQRSLLQSAQGSSAGSCGRLISVHVGRPHAAATRTRPNRTLVQVCDWTGRGLCSVGLRHRQTGWLRAGRCGHRPSQPEGRLSIWTDATERVPPLGRVAGFPSLQFSSAPALPPFFSRAAVALPHFGARQISGNVAAKIPLYCVRA